MEVTAGDDWMQKREVQQVSTFGKYIGLWQLDNQYFGGLFQFVFHDMNFKMIGNYLFITYQTDLYSDTYSRINFGN